MTGQAILAVLIALDYHQGTIASPMSAFCNNRETARRALFLLGFLNDAEGR